MSRKRDTRLKLTRKSKYSNIILPDKIDGTTGYHPNCYESFCAIGFSKMNSFSSIESSDSTAGESTSEETDGRETAESDNNTTGKKWSGTPCGKK